MKDSGAECRLPAPWSSAESLTLKCLADISQLLQENIPRRISASQAEVLHIYVDTSFDTSSYSGLGGVVIKRLKKKVIEAMMSKGQHTIIQEFEMMAVLGAFRSWEYELSRHRVLLFTDSEAVRGHFSKVGRLTKTVTV